MDNKINVIYMDTMSIKPYNRNARKNSVTVDKLCEIIPVVGFNQPIVVDKNNVIVKGHSRWKAAIKLGMEKVPVIISENDEETNKLDRLADNKLAEFSIWDEDLLKTELMSINNDDVDLSDLGFDVDFTEEIEDIAKNIEYVTAPEMPSDGPDEYEERHEVPQTPYMNPPQSATFDEEKSEKPFITEADIARTVPKREEEYGYVTCPNCGETVLYKK